MATLHIIVENQFRVSRFAQLADQVDGDLSEIIAQAEDFIERGLGRRFDEQVYVDISWVPVTSNTVFLEQRPITAVTAISRRPWHGAEWAALDTDDFRTYDKEGYLIADGVDVAGYEVMTTYTAGYSVANMPPSLQAAVIMQTALLIYQDLEIYGVGDSKKPGILYLQDMVDRYILPFKRMVL